jgi:hypothetical protein
VFRAFDPERDRLVAIKRFQLDVPPERMQELVASFERLIAANLAHPALAAPVAAGIDGTAAYLAMEYASGDSLDIAVRDYGPAPPADALRVATQLGGALDFAAVVNIGHGALHPRDVLLSTEETRLTGIGVARALASIGVTAPSRRPYSAPERLAGLEWDRRSDIFSLAALIHELLWAKRIAGTGSQAADALTEIAGGQLSALRAVFACALAEAPTDRFSTALEFANALKAALPDVAAAVSGESAPRRPRKSVLADARPAVPEGREPARVEPPAIDPVLRAEPRLPLGDAELPIASAPAPLAVTGSRGTRRPEAGELDLHEAEAARYEDVESAPSIPAAPSPRIDRPESHADFGDTRAPEFMATALEQSRSAVWPLVLALVVGVAMGFAGGYGVGSRDRTPPAPAIGAVAATAPAPATPQPLGSSGHESTEVAVSEAQKNTPVGSTGGDASSSSASATVASKADAGKPEAFEGRLLVRSTPSAARVFVDGHEYGKTPIAVRELSRGTHRVRVVREGYGTEERRVVLTTSRPAQSMTLPLERDRAQMAEVRKPAAEPKPETPATTGRFSAALTIESRPVGANVYLDGKLVGKTPLQLPDVAAGEHAVRLEHDGYRRWSSSVRIIAAEKNRITASLEEIR